MVEFAKFQGLGNDFIIVERDAEDVDPGWVRAICDRHLGVGADGVLALQRLDDACVRMVVFNQDGSRPQMCGNGVRCAAGYARTRWNMPPSIIVESDAGPRPCEIEDDESAAGRWQVNVAMGPARVSIDEEHILEVEGHRFAYIDVDMGNPHAVIFEMPSIETIDRAGRLANDHHPRFSQGVNVEFVEQRGDEWRTTVYERGVGRTQACGTGACAVAAAIWTQGLADPDAAVLVELPGGKLKLAMRDGQIWMRGPAQDVFTGTY